MFADYRVPQALYHFHCLHYSPELHQVLESGGLLPNGSPFEVEIRGNAIWAVELIRRRLLELIKEDWAAYAAAQEEEEEKEENDGQKVEKPKMTTVNAILIDYFIWVFAKEAKQDLSEGERPVKVHRTRSVFY